MDAVRSIDVPLETMIVRGDWPAIGSRLPLSVGPHDLIRPAADLAPDIRLLQSSKVVRSVLAAAALLAAVYSARVILHTDEPVVTPETPAYFLPLDSSNLTSPSDYHSNVRSS